MFAGLLGISFYSMPLAEKLAEIEPFKTTFLVGVWNRSWAYAAWWALLAGLALFMDRPFCKYLCPLGAALAVPTTFRFFGLKRKSECGPCDACAVGCSQLAIDKRGRIDQRECLLCLDCMVMYYDTHACPPLAKERKRRARAVVRPRQVAMYLAKVLTPRSYPEIGRKFGGRDHTTVMHADKKIRQLLAERRSVYNQVTELTNRIKQQASQR